DPAAAVGVVTLGRVAVADLERLPGREVAGLGPGDLHQALAKLDSVPWRHPTDATGPAWIAQYFMEIEGSASTNTPNFSFLVVSRRVEQVLELVDGFPKLVGATEAAGDLDRRAEVAERGDLQDAEVELARAVLGILVEQGLQHLPCLRRELCEELRAL